MPWSLITREQKCFLNVLPIEVFRKAGTVFENYAPESAAPGNPAKGDFVGWGGLGPTAVLFEYVFGIKADVPAARIVWDVRLLDAHGISAYPFGTAGKVELFCPPRKSPSEKPVIEASSDVRLDLLVRWPGGNESLKL